MNYFNERNNYYQSDNCILEEYKQDVQKVINRNKDILEDTIYTYFEGYKKCNIDRFKICLENMVNVKLKMAADLRSIFCKSDDTIHYYFGKELICIARYSDYTLLEKGKWYESL